MMQRVIGEFGHELSARRLSCNGRASRLSCSAESVCRCFGLVLRDHVGSKPQPSIHFRNFNLREGTLDERSKFDVLVHLARTLVFVIEGADVVVTRIGNRREIY